jgi:uncharacterized protein with FMN-binding domain
MRRIVLWFASTVSVLVLLFGYHTSTSGVTGAASQTAIVSGAAKSNAGTSSGSGGSSASAGSRGSGGSGSRSTAKAATRATKTVTGAVASTLWGPVQVQLTISGKTITKVAVVQYPNGNPRDAEINSQALPILMQETTSAQSANIDMVSGATVTSTGYLQSLQSALDQAGL